MGCDYYNDRLGRVFHMKKSEIVCERKTRRRKKVKITHQEEVEMIRPAIERFMLNYGLLFEKRPKSK